MLGRFHGNDQAKKWERFFFFHHKSASMAPWTHAQDIRVCVNFRKLGQNSKPEHIADGEQKKKVSDQKNEFCHSLYLKTLY